MRPFLAGPLPLLFAHRGGAALWPENTLVAFQEAVRLGITYLETDLHATRDGVLVVHHDHTVERTSNGYGLIREYRYADLRRLDAAYWHTADGRTYPYRGVGVHVPTLEEVFALAPVVKLNVEIKQHQPSIIDSLIRFINERGLQDRILVAAEHDSTVREFRKAAQGQIATSAGALEVKLFWMASRTGATRLIPIHYDALQVPVRYGPLTVVDRSFVDAAHRRGLHVHVWTINEAEQMQNLLQLGVDGLMSDRPDRLSTLRNHG